MKSVLVIDKPSFCADCKFDFEEKSCYLTGASFWHDRKFDYASQILDDCPLRNLPQKEVANEYDFEHYRNGVTIGWNRCLEKITGESEVYANNT